VVANVREAVVEFENVTKDFHGLRPLRVASLIVRDAERVAIAGFDRITAEIFVNMINGAILPDAGDVKVFGASTSAITDDDEWLASLDRFGIVTERAVLLDGMSIAQNLALPFSLEIDPMPEDVLTRVREMARDVAIDEQLLERPAVQSALPTRLRIHLGRALAVGPRVLLMEHPTASLPRDEVPAFARTVRATVESRGIALIALTDDGEFADLVAERALKLHAGTGALTSTRGWRRFLGG
jgi:predicted ABC-type transport system involved in lysophospholipase L1 biosynthesis ATPase subunit